MEIAATSNRTQNVSRGTSISSSSLQPDDRITTGAVVINQLAGYNPYRSLVIGLKKSKIDGVPILADLQQKMELKRHDGTLPGALIGVAVGTGLVIAQQAWWLGASLISMIATVARIIPGINRLVPAYKVDGHLTFVMDEISCIPSKPSNFEEFLRAGSGLSAAYRELINLRSPIAGRILKTSDHLQTMMVNFLRKAYENKPNPPSRDFFDKLPILCRIILKYPSTINDNRPYILNYLFDIYGGFTEINDSLKSLSPLGGSYDSVDTDSYLQTQAMVTALISGQMNKDLDKARLAGVIMILAAAGSPALFGLPGVPSILSRLGIGGLKQVFWLKCNL